MQKFITIRDIWMGLSVAGKTILYDIVLVVIALFVLSGFCEIVDDKQNCKYGFMVIMFMWIYHIIKVYWVNSKYQINDEYFIFPKSDMQNSILAIIFFMPYWNLAYSKKVRIDEIHNLYLDTQNKTTGTGKNKKKKTFYNLNVIGDFGSASLVFKSRQKRNEVRGILRQFMSKKGKKIDDNIAEFE